MGSEREALPMKFSAPIFRLKRRAKLTAREAGLPLHLALDRVAREEGYRNWSQLASAGQNANPAKRIFEQLRPGDMLLLGGRPGHGKTELGLDLAIEAARVEKSSFFFTLEENEASILARARRLNVEDERTRSNLIIDTSDDICADHIVNRVDQASGETFVVVDYLQILDQKRSKPELALQLDQLKRFAISKPSILVTLSQIDRAFELTSKRVPDLSDVRLPNPVDLALYTKACFLHDGEVTVQEMA
jgi:replicative DNA helicase